MYPSELGFQAFNTKDTNEIVLIFNEYLLVLHRGNIKSKIQLPIWKFTGTGKELLTLIPKQFDEQYMESIGNFFVKKEGKAYIAKVVSIHADGRITYDKIRDIEKN